MSAMSPNGKSGVLKKQETKSIALILLQKNIDKSATERNLGKSDIYECEGNSLFVFGTRNCFRCYVDRIVKG